ncbi:hypothetical protein [Burkholderia glumae]|uniref:hypothetical protein n=1 Tax=Burkholderia glumae TaxID=337 RepID=UPI0015949E22|nr:hypothetical protein [Burkholderia glumae]NVE22946.1 hypothetical protein [Burkholderia glumae]
MNCFINLTYFCVRLLILLLPDPKIRSASIKRPHLSAVNFLKSISTDPTELFGFPGSAALSAAEKRDYDQRFAARQLLFCSPRSTSSLITSLRPGPLAAQLRRLASPTSLPSPRRVSGSAKEA